MTRAHAQERGKASTYNRIPESINTYYRNLDIDSDLLGWLMRQLDAQT